MTADTRTNPPPNHIVTNPATLTAHAIDEVMLPPGRAGWATARTRRGNLCAWINAPSGVQR